MSSGTQLLKELLAQGRHLQVVFNILPSSAHKYSVLSFEVFLKHFHFHGLCSQPHSQKPASAHILISHSIVRIWEQPLDPQDMYKIKIGI